MSTISICVKDVSYAVGAKEILKGVSLTLEPGDLLGIVGPNGAGKSTLLKTIVRILKPTSGEIRLSGIEINDIPARQLAKEIAFVPQDTDFSFPFSVLDVVLMGRAPYISRLSLESSRDYETVTECLTVVDMDGFEQRFVTNLSGGEKQLVAIARALAQEPTFMLLDEPTSYLDIHHQLTIMGLLKRLSQEQKGIAVVLHDLKLAHRFCNKIILLDSGRAVAFGSPEGVLNAENISKVFNVKVIKTTHPLTGQIIIEPIEPLN